MNVMEDRFVVDRMFPRAASATGAHPLAKF